MKKASIFILTIFIIGAVGFYFLRMEIEKVTQESIKRIELTFREETKSLEETGWHVELHIPSEQVKIPTVEALKLAIIHRGVVCAPNIEITMKGRIREKINLLIKKACFLSTKNEMLPLKFEQIDIHGFFPKELITMKYHSDRFLFTNQSAGAFKSLKATIDKVFFSLSSKGKLFNLKLTSQRGLFSYKIPHAPSINAIIKIIEDLPTNTQVFHTNYALMGDVTVRANYPTNNLKEEALSLKFDRIDYKQELVKTEDESFDYKNTFDTTVKSIHSTRAKTDAEVGKLLPLKLKANLEVKSISQNLLKSAIHFFYTMQKTPKEAQLSELLTMLSTVITELTLNPPYVVFSFNANPNNLFDLYFQVKFEIERLKNLVIQGRYSIKNCNEFKKQMKTIAGKDIKEIEILKSENGTCKGNFSETIPLGNMLNLTPKMP